jgi:hypothetical protein
MNRIRPIPLALVVMSAFQLSVSAGRLSLSDGLSRPFYAPALNIQWGAPTNDLPRTVIVFEPVPDERPAVTLSNLMAIEQFHHFDNVKTFDPNGRLRKSVYAFRATNNGSTLVYDSRRGTIDFNDETAFHGPGTDEKVERVPDEPAALELALQLLRQLRISTNDMVKKASGELRCVFPTGSWGRLDKKSRQVVDYVHRRGVGFTRSLDGKEVVGWRAVFVEFGNNAKLGKLEVRWCTLKPAGSYLVAQPARILQWIKEGRAMVQSLSGPNDARYVRVADIRKLTISSIQPRYPYIDEDNPPQYLYPFAVLTASAEFGNDDTEKVFLYCPLISEGLPKAQRPSNADFSIYPSSRARVH